MPILPAKVKPWTLPPTRNVQEIIRAYESGMAGCTFDPAAKEELMGYGETSAEDICYRYGYVDAGKGQLVAPFLAIENGYPNALPGPAQQRGSCVADALSRAILTTLCCEAWSGDPDPISGHIEEYPEVSALAEENSVIAMENVYRYRGHRSDGWYCAAAINVAVKKTGAVLRKDYGFVDLEDYSPDWAGAAWNESQLSEQERNAFDDNLVHDAVPVKDYEQMRDLQAAGFGILSCGGESWSNKRDEHGYSPRTSKGWAHALWTAGCDDRPETHKKYGGPLVIPGNQWGVWSSGPRTLYQSDVQIPEGCWTTKWSDFKRRDIYAVAGVKGWQRKLLPNLLGGFV